MKGTALNAALDELGVDKDNFRILGLLPLVYVAWADGKVQRAERSLIHRLAKMNGWLGDDGDALLSEWLEEPPSEQYVAQGLEVLRALSAQTRGLGIGVHEDSLRSLVAYCRDVAAAAGGMFGLHAPITDAEEAALTQIAGALGVDSGSSWREIAGAADEHDHKLPPGPRGHILVGNLLEFNASPVAFLQDAANTYGDVVHFTVANEDVFLLRRPEHVQYVLQENLENYQRGFEYAALEKVIGRSLLTTEGHRWKKLRRISQPAFSKKRIDAFDGAIVDATDAMLERWESDVGVGAQLDVAAEMMRLTLEIIGKLMFSFDLSDSASELGEAVAIVLEHANHAMSNPLRIPDVVPTKKNRRFREAMDRFDALFGRMIAERRESGTENGDLLGMLMAARDDETGERLEDGELESEMLTFLVAGHETTSIALMWSLYALSKHAVPARRVHREIRDKLPSRRPTAADAELCPYLQLFIDETMRLYPPVWAVGRSAQVDDDIGGYRVPKGSIVMLSPWVTHRDPSTWDNPEGFDPERFTARASQKRHKTAYFPFAAGPHKCVGMGLAMLELRLVLPRILQRFRLDLLPGFEPGFDPQLTLKPKHGMQMTLRRA